MTTNNTEKRCDACYAWHDRPRSLYCSAACQQAAKRADAELAFRALARQR